MLSRGQQVILDILRINDYLESNDDIRIDCPFCGNTSKKMYISNKVVYHCFVCGESGGSVTKFLATYFGTSYFKVKELLKDYEYTDSFSTNLVQTDDAKLADSIIADLTPLKESATKLSMIPLPTNTKKLLDNYYNPEAFPYFSYLKRRGVTKQQLSSYDIRYVIRGKSITAHGKDLYVNNSLLFVTYMNGVASYWNTRSIESNPYIKTYNASGDPDKYYSKRNSVFNYDLINSGSTVVVCEGVFNAMTVQNTGLSNLAPVATFGKQITKEQLLLIINKNPKYIYLYLDNDAYDIELDLVKRIVNLGYPIEKIKLVPNRFGDKDANDIGTKECRISLLEAKNYSFSDIMKEEIEMNLEV